MKRAVLVLFGFVLVAGFVAAWWFLRDTPEKVLRDGFRNLMAVKSASNVSLDVAWTGAQSRVTTGFSVVGQVDSRDLTRPRALGVLRFAEGVFGPEQTADAVLDLEKIALRPRGVSEDVRLRYEALTHDPQGRRFAVLLRDPFLEKHGFGHFIANGSSDDIRANLPAFIQVVRHIGPITKTTNGGKHLSTVAFTIDRIAMKPFLISMLRVWNGDNPTPDELLWVDSASTELARGTFRITIDRTTRLPVVVEGEWPLMDKQENERARIRIRLEVEGLNARVAIGIPEDAVDVTDDVLERRGGGATLPRAPLRPLPRPSGATGTAFGPGDEIQGTITFETTTRRFIDEEQIDLWSKYTEELKRKKSLY